MASKKLLTDQAATGAGATAYIDGVDKTLQAWGSTTAGTGSATIQVQGSVNDGESWDVLGTITLTLGTTVTSDGFASADRYPRLRGNVTAISGTGAKVSLAAAY